MFIVGLALIYVFFFKKEKRERLKTNSVLVIAKITGGTTSPSRGGTNVILFYNFRINDENIEVTHVYNKVLHHGIDKFVGKSFPVLVSERDHEINEILISPDDFSYFGMTYPDSLEWVKEYLWR